MTHLTRTKKYGASCKLHEIAVRKYAEIHATCPISVTKVCADFEFRSPTTFWKSIQKSIFLKKRQFKEQFSSSVRTPIRKRFLQKPIRKFRFRIPAIDFRIAFGFGLDAFFDGRSVRKPIFEFGHPFGDYNIRREYERTRSGRMLW